MIEKIILAIFLSTFLGFIFSKIRGVGIKVSKTMTDDNFTVMLPNIVAIIGLICALMSLAVVLAFTFLSNEVPHLIFYLVFGAFIWLGMYLFIKTLTFKVVVSKNIITVYSALRKPYSFTFDEITSALRQVKMNRVKSERVVITTVNGKKLIVESSEISYNRFVKKLKLEVKSEKLIGF